MSDLTIWFFITSGLFLGWSLGANNAVALFGTAVSSKMLKFRVAAIIAGVFTVIGSFISGDGTTSTITSLGGINAIAGSFTVALSVAVSVTWMTRARLPVSASQAVVGAIIGWNLFTGSPTDYTTLSNIVGSWLVSPVIAGAFGFLIFKLMKRTVLTWRIHMLTMDNATRIGLIVVGALASYTMGANNIANVMGMFVPASPLGDLEIGGLVTLSGGRLLFFIGGVSIAVGIFTYGHKVMKTVGSDLFKISPITGFAVVLSEFIVMFLFTSQSLETLLLSLHLPTIPLVPLSVTQAFIGAVIGVGLAKDPQTVDFRVFGRITVGWVVAPVTAGILAFVLLYVVQNVFEQKVIDPRPYDLSASVVRSLAADGVDTAPLADLEGRRFATAREFRNALKERHRYTNRDLVLIYQTAIVDSFHVDSLKIAALDTNIYNPAFRATLRSLVGRSWSHRLEFESDMFADSSEWRTCGDMLRDRQMMERKRNLEELMRVRLVPAR